MILKIERYNDSQEWWMYDNIRRVSISKKFYKQDMTSSEDNDFHLIISDVESSCTCKPHVGDECSSCVPFRIIRCTLNSDSEISIAFDTIAYLLNDDGKTIEKIVANYNKINKS